MDPENGDQPYYLEKMEMGERNQQDGSTDNPKDSWKTSTAMCPTNSEPKAGGKSWDQAG